MKLELANFQVKEVVFGNSTRLIDGRLQVDRGALERLVLEDNHFNAVDFHLARPGERVRIVHALDVVEPRLKVSGPGCVFPGVLGQPITVGQGRTHCLRGMAVITAGLPVRGETLYSREAIIDMSGPGARYSPYSITQNLVVEIHGRPDPDLPNLGDTDSLQGTAYAREYNLAVRVAGFKIARYLAEATRDRHPDHIEVFQLAQVDPSLPRIAYALQVSRQHVYGEFLGWQPTLLHPNELMDGVMFSSFNTIAGMRESTYFYMNHPIVGDLYKRHGRDLNFVGILVHRVGNEEIAEKERITSYGANLLKMIDAHGAILTFVGAGHPSVDIMMLCRKCEGQGIKTTILYPEMALTADDSGFSDYVPEANAIVSTGNYEKQITLPPVEQVFGGATILGSGLDASGAVTVSLHNVYGSASPMGESHLMGVQY